MAKKKKMDVVSELMELGLSKAQMGLFFESVHEKFWEDSITLYKEMEIVRDTLDEPDKLYLLLRGFDKKGYDVNLEIIDGKFAQFCSCSNKEKKGCEHVGCALLYKMIKEKHNDFNDKLAKQEKFSGGAKRNELDYFKNLLPVVPTEEKKYMIYFNFEEFDLDRQILSIERGVIRKSGSYGAPVKFQGKNFDGSRWDISKNVRKALDFINGDNYGMRYSTGGFQKSRFYDVNTDLMMPAIKKVYFEEKELILGATFAKDTFEIKWEIKKKGESYILNPMFVCGDEKKDLTDMKIVDIGNTRLWFFDSDSKTFYEYKHTEKLNVARGILRYPKKLELSKEELREFFSKYYQEIIDNFEVTVSRDIKRNEKSVIPVAKVYLEKSGSTAKVKLKFDYGGQLVDYFSSNKEVVLIEKDVIYDVHRDFEYEDEIIEKLNDLSIVTHEDKDEFVIESDLIDFVSEDIPRIVELGVEVLGEDKLFNFKVIKTKPKMDLKVSQSTDWFELKGNVSFGKEKVNVNELLEAIFKNKRFIELSDGKRAVIPKDWVKSMKSYGGFFDLEDETKLSKYHVGILDTLISISDKNTMDSTVKKVVESFRNFDKIEEVKVSPNVKANLREYQKAGYNWMSFLQKTGFNGVLADDMGLGKTLQTLTLLQKAKDDGLKKPILVVVPTSLVFNWKAEAQKFTPKLKANIYHGIRRNKKGFETMLKNNDLIITTYGVLRNDLELFSSQEFEYIILDEAHIIKNPMSVSAKSVFTLNSKHKLVISGTPIQNNLTELWSLFNFLNPGYLGSYEFFKESFVTPIENAQDKNISSSLKKLISPFILRRTKKVISNELPEKTEIILRESFTEEERAIYDTWKEYYKTEIKNSINEKGMGSSKMKILEGLMKLRQICLSPSLIDTEYKGESSKLKLLMMEVKKVMAEGHKVLIFSSFVKMLDLVKEEFERRGLRYSYLDGKTRNREKVVSNFQNAEEAEAFLISIKAGGVGLNLTSADYVFIIDPWWNPAVESQAMDRAHRIGQESKVFVYKTIMENTIEEKIVKLQESKKKLVEDLIVEDEATLKNIDMKDIDELFA